MGISRPNIFSNPFWINSKPLTPVSGNSKSQIPNSKLEPETWNLERARSALRLSLLSNTSVAQDSQARSLFHHKMSVSAVFWSLAHFLRVRVPEGEESVKKQFS